MVQSRLETRFRNFLFDWVNSVVSWIFLPCDGRQAFDLRGMPQILPAIQLSRLPRRKRFDTNCNKSLRKQRSYSNNNGRTIHRRTSHKGGRSVEQSYSPQIHQGTRGRHHRQTDRLEAVFDPGPPISGQLCGTPSIDCCECSNSEGSDSGMPILGVSRNDDQCRMQSMQSF